MSVRQDVFLHSQCPSCQYRYGKCCIFHPDCETCPMYFKPRQDDGIHHHCHCLALATTEERKSGKCKFFKQKEEED